MTETKFAKLTDEMIAKSRQTIGHEKKARNPWNEAATKDNIKHFAWAYGDLNPLWLDEEYARHTAWGTLLAPPLFPLTTQWGPLYPTESAGSKGSGFPGLMSLYSGTQFTFYDPIKLDDRIENLTQYVGVVDSSARQEGDLIEPAADVARAFENAALRWGGSARMVDQVRQHKTYNRTSGELACVCLDHQVRVERGLVAPEEGKYRDLRLPWYTEKDLARIYEAYENEFRRGREVLYWEDVNVGDELPTIVHGPLTINSMILFLMGCATPFSMTDRPLYLFFRRFPAANMPDPQTNVPDTPERAHWDPYMASTMGWPRPYDFGYQPLCWLGHCVTNWMGDDGVMRSLSYWRPRLIFIFETVWVHGRVVKKEKTSKEALVYVELWGDTQEGERCAEGRASVALRSRSQ